MRDILILAMLCLLVACQPSETPAPAETAPEIEYLTVEGSTAPFSEAVRVGNMLYLSGQLGFDRATRKLAPGGVEAETRQAMENIRQTLERHGSSLDRVVKVTVMMADMQEWPKMNEVYKTFFPDHYPARSAFGATALAGGARLEIECIAVIEGNLIGD
jgi:reactive intermediate/imine deaminase